MQYKILTLCDIITYMQIPIETILDFHTKRIQAHIRCVNYFAGLIGYHFPEHDNDKLLGTIRNGYAYMAYKKYHPEFMLTKAQHEFYTFAHDEHHKTQPHHLEYYKHDVSRISDITLIEMICDWHSASFEQRFITHEDSIGYSVYDYFSTHLHHLKWSPHQLGLIQTMFDFLDMYTSHTDVMSIWAPLTDGV